MSKSTLPWTVKQLQNMYEDKKTLLFNHPIQREGGQWNALSQSLLIHSILDEDFVVPQFFFLKEATAESTSRGVVNNYYVIDGKQRLSIIFDYINGKFKLHKDTPDLEREDTEPYVLANKAFADLDSEHQEDILRYKMNIVNMESVDDEKLEEIFFRLNNGCALSTNQKAKAKMGIQMAIFVDKLLAKKFFAEICSFSATQLRKKDDMCALLQAMMLLDGNYEYKSISATEALDYAVSIRDKYTDEQKEELEQIVDFLGDSFIDKDKNCKKINIPMLFLMTRKALAQKIDYADFLDWYKDFFGKYDKDCDYAGFCSTGSIKKEKTLGRISVMSESFDTFFKDYHIGEDEETAKVTEVTETETDDKAVNE
jgi:hypothetical protein